MDILIPNKWLKKFLKTTAKPQDIGKYLSLCGPSVEKVEKTSDNDHVYHIEITTNRVDCASVVGIAREACAILPRFGIKAKMANVHDTNKSFEFVKKVNYLKTTVDKKLCPRFCAVLVKNVVIKDSPLEIRSLLKKSGIRPINNIVDVSNYIMLELGQPVHTFDYDKISGSKMVLRESKSGEKITTLDGKTFSLNKSDIVIEDGSGKLIDLCGIMGAQNSAINKKTRNVLLFVQTYDKHHIRKTSMGLAQRTKAAVLFEKGLDPELVEPAMLSAISMIEKLSEGTALKEILDIYPVFYKAKFVRVHKDKIDKTIGVSIEKKDITKYLTPLGFKVVWESDLLIAEVPSFRSEDISIEEDIIEEIARIYGYHNLEGEIMSGKIPDPSFDDDFEFENKIKISLKSLGGVEVYNLSLVSKELAGNNALGLINPLGPDSKYLRTSLKNSLVSAVQVNTHEKDKVHMFELSNIYLQKSFNLPDEKLTLGGIIKNGEYRENRGVVEVLLEQLGIDYQTSHEDAAEFLPNQRMAVYSKKQYLGQYGNLENGHFYYEFDFLGLLNSKKVSRAYQAVSKYPPQIEDITFVLPLKTRVGDVAKTIKETDKQVARVELGDIYKDAYTFNIWYQNPNKTLTDTEVKTIREKFQKNLKAKFGATTKD